MNIYYVYSAEQFLRYFRVKSHGTFCPKCLRNVWVVDFSLRDSTSLSELWKRHQVKVISNWIILVDCLIGIPIMDYSAIVPAKQEGYIAAWCSRVSRVFDPERVAIISKFCFSTMHLLIARMSQKVSTWLRKWPIAHLYMGYHRVTTY